jgi:hypothetical protein
VDTPATAKDGWHVNVRVRSKSISTGEKTSEDISLPEELNTYIVNPQTPSRVFA